jgi:hypothetical protein
MRVYPVLFVFGVIACSVDTHAPSTGGLRVEIETIEQSSSWTAVTFRVSNDYNAAVYVSRCGEALQAAVDRRTSTWALHTGGACLAIHDASPQRLEPGEGATGIVSVREPGAYRIRIGIAHSARDALQWSPTSAEFSVLPRR